jgi:exonuclease III
VRSILDLLTPLQDTTHVLVGDFNAVHPEDSVGELPPDERPGYIARQPIELILKAGYTDCYRLLHRDTPGYTYPAQHPWLRLDYIFASVPLAVRLCACDVDSAPPAQRASDHLPVWAEFG